MPNMPMFDPIYCTEVLNDILGRRGVQLVLTPKSDAEMHEDGKTDPQLDPRPSDRAG